IRPGGRSLRCLHLIITWVTWNGRRNASSSDFLRPYRLPDLRRFATAQPDNRDRKPRRTEPGDPAGGDPPVVAGDPEANQVPSRVGARSPPQNLVSMNGLWRGA